MAGQSRNAPQGQSRTASARDEQRADSIIGADSPVFTDREPRFGFPNEVKAIRPESEAADDIHDVMLIGQDGGKSDQDEPDVGRVAQQAARVARIKLREDGAKA